MAWMTFRVLGNFMSLPYDLRDFSAVMIGASEKIFQEVFLRRSEPGSLGDARKNFEIRRVLFSVIKLYDRVITEKNWN